MLFYKVGGEALSTYFVSAEITTGGLHYNAKSSVVKTFYVF
jgi:hypothetical protein